MIVRRTPDKRIKIVHTASGDVFDLKVLGVDCHNDRVRVGVDVDYDKNLYYVGVTGFYLDAEGPLRLYHDGSIHLRHFSGEEMTIQAIRIAGKDVDFRLHDPARRFEFLWSDRRLPA